MSADSLGRSTFSWLCVLLAAATAGGCDRNDNARKGADKPRTITTAAGVEMVAIPGGFFQMGSTGGRPDEKPVHRVWIDAFVMDRFEVTQDQFRKLSIPDPSHFKGPRRPVEHITFADAIEFCNERSAAEGLAPCYRRGDGGAWTCDANAPGYRLPSEAEWEYACRAGTAGERYFAPDTERALRQYAWFVVNSGKQTHEVGGLRANAWGLCDMYGNVAEWCQDTYDPNYYAASPGRNPRGPAGPMRRVVLRGGAWDSPADRCRSAVRAGEDPRFTDACFAKDTIGFRCVRKTPPAPPETR